MIRVRVRVKVRVGVKGLTETYGEGFALLG